MSDSAKKAFSPHSDFARLQELFPAVREFQKLASNHGIADIFQDNGGKILQLCLCLGISVLPGREGNDAVDSTTGGQFELKTLNFLTKGGFTTHHHLNPIIIAKYRKVDWIFAAYEGIELRAIWRLTPVEMEPWFQFWEKEWHDRGGKDLNNPKVARRYVMEHGELLYSIGGPLEISKPRKGSAPKVQFIRDTDLIDARQARLDNVDVIVGNPPFAGKPRGRPRKA